MSCVLKLRLCMCGHEPRTASTGVVNASTRRPRSAILDFAGARAGREGSSTSPRASVILPPRVADYVTVHELALLHEANHTSESWARVERAPTTSSGNSGVRSRAGSTWCCKMRANAQQTFEMEGAGALQRVGMCEGSCRFSTSCR